MASVPNNTINGFVPKWGIGLKFTAMILMETKKLASGWPEKTAGYGPHGTSALGFWRHLGTT